MHEVMGPLPAAEGSPGALTSLVSCTRGQGRERKAEEEAPVVLKRERDASQQPFMLPD